jgi:hypothetical protein
MNKLAIALTTSLFIVFYSCTKDSETQEPPDTTAPVVALSIAGMPNVSEGETIVVGSQIVVNVDAEDAGGIARIEAFINDEKVGEDTQAPYSITINLTSFTSKVGKSGVFIDYTLKVIATDLAGNTTPTEQKIHIDDQIPTITDVSLEDGIVLSGNTNSVTFDVLDNEELSSVLVYINDNLNATINDANYVFNLDTSVLEEGENTFKIEAKDLAGNTANHSVQFIVDNTGPEITLGSLKDGQLIDEMIPLSPVVADAYSDVSLVEIYFDDELIYTSEDASEIIYNLDPNNYPAGESILKIRTIDSLGNSSEMEWSVKVVRLLIKITIPDGYLSPNIQTNHFVFASESDGSVIDLKEIIFETREVKLYANGEFDIEKDFTVTFASLGRNGVASYLFSVAHVNRQNLKQLNLSVPKRYSGVGATYYPINGFSETTQLFCFGRDYYFSSSEAGETLIQNFVPSNHSSESGPIYIYGFNPLNNFYNYQFVDRPIDSNFEINFSDFDVQNLVEGQLTTSPADFLNNARSFTLYGFRSQEDLDNDIYHQLWSYGYGQNISSPFIYQVNTLFYEYAHELIIGNYQAKGAGLPPDITVIPDWSIDYTFQNNSVSLTKSGAGHFVGELYLEGGYDVGVPYQWNVYFDSNKDEDIVLPNIPEVLQVYPFYNLYQDKALELGRVGLRKYDNMNSYNDYLEQIIKANKAFRRSAPRYESIFSGNTTQAFSNTDYFYNWW